jgi:hypothetical protein
MSSVARPIAAFEVYEDAANQLTVGDSLGRNDVALLDTFPGEPQSRHFKIGREWAEPNLVLGEL